MCEHTHFVQDGTTPKGGGRCYHCGLIFESWAAWKFGPLWFWRV